MIMENQILIYKGIVADTKPVHDLIEAFGVREIMINPDDCDQQIRCRVLGAFRGYTVPLALPLKEGMEIRAYQLRNKELELLIGSIEPREWKSSNFGVPSTPCGPRGVLCKLDFNGPDENIKTIQVAKEVLLDFYSRPENY